MADEANAHIELAELKRLLEAADPGAVLVPPRILRRIIKHHRRLPVIGLQVPHRKTYVIDRETLCTIADPAELELEPNRQLPQMVVLISSPDPERLAVQPRGEALVRIWGMLFHGSVHAALERRVKEGKLTEEGARARIDRIGQTPFDEIRVVLQHEKYLLAAHDDLATYIEFVAVYLDLVFFAPPLLPRYFPGLGDCAGIDKIVAADIDGAALFKSTRLEGAPDPLTLAAGKETTAAARAEQLNETLLAGEYKEGSYLRLRQQAEKARARGNAVRAAILCQRAVRAAGPELAAPTQAAAGSDLEQLAGRLRAALDLSESATREWGQALVPLLPRAASGYWPVEARLLYDLQKVCTEHERETYALDIMGWILSAGKLRVKRLLPNHRAVLMTTHLRRALRRLARARITEDARRRLATLLHEVVEQSEERLRTRLRPLVTQTLDQVDLRGRNYPECIARKKLIEELLDLVVRRGFVTIGNLRDAISRNNLKLPDLANADEFFLGDRLLRTNRRLAVAWDGVYHRSEIYLRWLQRLSSLAFGTRPGRFLTRYLALPYGIAYVALEGLLHLIHLVAHYTGGAHFRLSAQETLISVVVFGTFLFALLHSAAFRRHFVDALGLVMGGLRAAVIDGPAYLLQLPLVRQMLESRPFALARDYVLKPLCITAVIAVFFPLYGMRQPAVLASSGVIFLSASFLLNTRLGRTVEELTTDALAKTWLRFRADVFPAMYDFTMSLFSGLIEAVERVLYTVDEWLRFRTGQGRLTLVGKTILSFVWFFVTYFVRIYVNLFVEPTVNPIKHFPVVTVSAKLLVPFYPFLFRLFETLLMPLGPALAKALATLNVILVPGIFGFFVWEFKENWRLYAANRPKLLRPVLIGHHGETMSRFLRPGFHSGTIPNLYTKLRRAERRSYRSGQHVVAHKYREALHHVEEYIRHFVEREFLELLGGSKNWGQVHLTVGNINIATNRVAIEFCRSSAGAESAWIAFEERSGWLVARIARPGWLSELSVRQLAAWSTALAGLYKLGSVDVVCEQAAGQLLFRSMPIPWLRWVEAWEADQAGKCIPSPIVDGLKSE